MKLRALIGIIVVAIGLGVPSTQPSAQTPASSPVTRIAYESCYFETWDLFAYVCDIAVWADGIQTIVAPLGYTPRWSPDGSRIVFVGSSWQSGIKVVNLDDLSVYNLSDQASDAAPTWSPDGSAIAFVSYRTGTPELYRVNDDGTGFVRLTTAIGFNGRYAWSPDGRTIALGRDVAGQSDLYAINADGSGLARLTSGAGGIGEVNWYSDSTRIVFDCATGVCVVNADSTGFARLTGGPAHSAAFAPGDGRIAFVTTSFGPAPEVAVRNEDGAIIRVAAGMPGTNPVWSPDGASLLFEGTNPIGYEGCCSNGCNGDTYCTPVYGFYTVSAIGSYLGLFGKGSNADWFRPRAGQPLASFSHQCAAASCDFDAGGSSDPDGTIASYAWRFGDGTTGTGTTTSHTYRLGGTFLVTLIVTDNDGMTSAASRSIVANAPPTASFLATCMAGVCTFDASGATDADGTIASYEWTFGDGATLSQPSGSVTAVHVYRTGTFTVQLVVRDNAGASAMASTTVQTVNDPPVAAFTRSCDGVRCIFDASASVDPEKRPLLHYSWNFGDGSGGFGAINEHTYPAPGTYQVVLTVADDSGQLATASQTITVQPGSMHVGDLDGTGAQDPGRSSIVRVTVVVHDGQHRPLANATVAGSWSSGVASQCTTDGIGQCTVATVVQTHATATFTIQSVVHSQYVYRGPSHDPDGDSDGTRITFKRK